MREKASNVFPTEFKSASDDEKRIDVDVSEGAVAKSPYAVTGLKTIDGLVGSRERSGLHSQCMHSKTER
jgi:hypothetical protein